MVLLMVLVILGVAGPVWAQQALTWEWTAGAMVRECVLSTTALLPNAQPLASCSCETDFTNDGQHTFPPGTIAVGAPGGGEALRVPYTFTLTKNQARAVTAVHGEAWCTDVFGGQSPEKAIYDASLTFTGVDAPPQVPGFDTMVVPEGSVLLVPNE